MIESIASVIGAITGSLSLIGFIYTIGYWKGKVDSSLDQIKAHPPAEIHQMVKTMWEVYVVDALRGKPELANHGSAYRLKPEAEDLIPPIIKKALAEFPVCANSHGPRDAHAYLVVKCLGVSAMRDLSDQLNMSVRETTALLALYMEKLHPSGLL